MNKYKIVYADTNEEFIPSSGEHVYIEDGIVTICYPYMGNDILSCSIREDLEVVYMKL